MSEIKQPAAPMHRQTDERLSLSAEEQIIIKKLQDEAFFYRGLPLALTSGMLCTYMLKKKFPQMAGIRSFGLSLVAAVSGNLVGKVTYAPEMIRRLEKELPDDSELKRQILSRRSSPGGGDLIEMPGTIADPFGVPPAASQNAEVGFNEVSIASDNQRETSAVLEDSKYVTYDDLRKKHRQSLDWKQPKVEVVDEESTSPAQDEFPSRLSRPRSPPVRYNKYGDPILEE